MVMAKKSRPYNEEETAASTVAQAAREADTVDLTEAEADLLAIDTRLENSPASALPKISA